MGGGRGVKGGGEVEEGVTVGGGGRVEVDFYPISSSFLCLHNDCVQNYRRGEGNIKNIRFLFQLRAHRL